MDMEQMTEKELQELVEQAMTAMTAARQREQQARIERRARLGVAIEQLKALLGPEGSPPYDPGSTQGPTIRGLQAHTEETLGAHAGLVLDLVLSGLEVIVTTERELAKIQLESS